MFAEDISEDSQISLLLDFIVFLDIFEIFAEDCFLPRSFRKFLPSGFLPLSRFQETPCPGRTASRRKLKKELVPRAEIRSKYLFWGPPGRLQGKNFGE